MRIGCVLVFLANIIYLLDGWEITNPLVDNFEILMDNAKMHDIDSVFVQSALISDECEVNYAYERYNPGDYSIKKHLNFKRKPKPGDKVRIAILAAGKDHIQTRNIEYTIKANGFSVIDLRPNATCKSVPERKVTPAESPRSTCEKLIFEDDFNDDQILTDKWAHQVIYKNSYPQFEFVAFVSDPINSNITNNKLHITMTDGIGSGKILLNDCIGTKHQCGDTERHHLAPEIKRSANLYSKFTFKYGRIEIRAQMPRGDFLFPNILLEPKMKKKESPKDQIRLYSRGNDLLQDRNGLFFDGRSLFGSVLLWNEKNNVWKPSEYWTLRQGKHKDLHYSRDLHNYTIIWQEKIITFKVDGVHVGDITEPAILERFYKHECHLVLGLTAGGRHNFDDNVLNEHHKNYVNTNPKAEQIFIKHFDKERTTPLIVDNIRVYELNDC